MGDAARDLPEEGGRERVLLVSLQGALTGGSDFRWLDAVTEAAGLSGAVAVDLRETGSIDLGGACSLVKLHTWAGRVQTPIALFGAQPPVVHVLELTRLAEAVPLFPTEAEALAHLSVSPSGRPPRPPVNRDAAGAAPGWAPSTAAAQRRVLGPLEGFGPLWEHVFQVRLTGAPESPEAVMAIWRSEFPAFWPPGNVARLGPAGLSPGETVGFTLALPGGLPLPTGGFVLYGDERSFGLATLEGHVQAGWIRFSAFTSEGATVAEVRSLVRAGDPLFDAGMSLVGQRHLEEFWQGSLESLAGRLGVRGLAVSASSCLDARRQWARAANARHNAGVESLVYGALGLARRILPGRR